jgi:universal stress protein E
VRREFDRLLQRSGIPPARRHLQLADVAGELQATATSIKAAIVVMGAVSRSGLSRLFIGSTAERALDRLTCDVLIIKSRGFKVTIPRRALRG